MSPSLETVRAELARLGQSDNVVVEAKGCVVTLTGQVADPELRWRLSGALLDLPEVYGVCNELDVSAP
ncbi:BON domain-containing protein [Phenylobacterium sp. LjRoot219]|uniref:hypothetical protein n=1 Tax=Phenylobacterium sp. LjRoot219 TaxID=3342283 RepID=UPI003ECC6597